MLAGVAASLIGAVAAEVVRSQKLAEQWPRVGEAAGIHRLLWTTITDTALIFRALWDDLRGKKPIRGAFRALPFDQQGDDPRSAAHRAIVAFRVTFTPNTYVVDFDADDERVLVHQFVPSTPEHVRDQLEAKL